MELMVPHDYENYVVIILISIEVVVTVLTAPNNFQRLDCQAAQAMCA